jgi:hypothetical protein
MSFKKKFIDIDPKQDKEKYIIYTELKQFGKAIIEETDKKNEWWRTVSKQIGHDANKLGKQGGEPVILPPSSNQDHKVGYVITNKGIVVKEEKIGDKSRFFFDLIK